jgi:ABC-type multidrug transport system fused ATPase/permease subunit
MELDSINVHKDSIGSNNHAPGASSEALELEWNKVSLTHGNKQLLFGVSGKVKGKFLAIIGGSGSGKVYPCPICSSTRSIDNEM